MSSPNIARPQRAYVFNKPWDPCYGLNMHRPGDVVIIEDELPNTSSLCDIRIVASSADSSMNYCGISFDEIRGHVERV